MNVLAQYKFVFKRKLLPFQQVHRIIHETNGHLDIKHVCVAVYLDVAEASDKVWHARLLHK